MYLSSTFADPKTSSPPGSPRAHMISCANKYAKTMRRRACTFCMARFSRWVPPYNLNFGILPVTAVKIPRTAVTAASIVIPFRKKKRNEVLFIMVYCGCNFSVSGWNPGEIKAGAVLSCGDLQGGSSFYVCRWNPSVWPFKWKLLSSTSMWYCLLCYTRRSKLLSLWMKP